MRRDPLRFYPPAWRERYGDEMRALIEDDLGGRSATRRYRTRLAFAGLRERARSSGVAGDSPADARRMAGSSIVLFSWVAVCAAGGSFAKVAEHFRSALRPSARLAPDLSFATVVAGAVLGLMLVGVGVAVALPGYLSALRAGRVTGLRRAVVPALVLTAVGALSLLGLSVWAHHLTSAQRNGSDSYYSAAFVGWGVVCASALALWARMAVTGARLSISSRVLRWESWLAYGVTVATAVVTGASALWWAEIAARDPRFLSGAIGGSPVTAPMVVTLGLMALALLASAYGVARIATAHRTRIV